MRWERRVIKSFAVEIIAWGVIGYGSKSQLMFIRGTINIQRYVDAMVEAHILPYLEDQLFQQDNVRIIPTHRGHLQVASVRHISISYGHDYPDLLASGCAN